MTRLDEIVRAVLDECLAEAEKFERLEARGQAAGMRYVIAKVDAGLRDAADEPLTLEEAGKESGYSPERLRKLIADGTIPQAGRKHAPRVKRGDLPSRARRPASAYSADEDALRLVRGS